MSNHVVLGVHLKHKSDSAVNVQAIFSKYNKNIKTRIGLNDPDCTVAQTGLILLEMTGEAKEWQPILSELQNISGVDVKQMAFEDADKSSCGCCGK